MNESKQVSPPDLAEFYSWPSGWWVRAMMLHTLDGAYFGPDGSSKSLSNPRDRDVLLELRRGAEVVLVGAATIRAERYKPMKSNAVVVIVSPSLDLPWEEPRFGESTHLPIVLTGVTRGEQDEQALQWRKVAIEMQDAGRVRIIELEDPAVDSLDYLRDQGYERIVCEGGPRLLESLFPFIDELDLTTAPVLVGTVPVDAAENSGQGVLGQCTEWELANWWSEDQYTYAKYLRKK
ncbi:MAG: dihydrofolate reductase family protein [Candidatus Nanopelagicales bacterium]